MRQHLLLRKVDEPLSCCHGGCCPGVLVVRPDADMFAELLEKLPSLTSYDGGDTGE